MSLPPVENGVLFGIFALSALNGRLPPDQQLAGTPETRALLHWGAAEGYVSVRLFAQTAGSPSCNDAGKRF